MKTARSARALLFVTSLLSPVLAAHAGEYDPYEADRSNYQYIGAGAEAYKNNAGGNNLGGFAEFGYKEGLNSVEAKIGGVGGSKNGEITGSGDGIVAWDAYDGGINGETYWATQHKLVGDPNQVRISPLGVGLTGLSKTGDSRWGAFVHGWNYEQDLVNKTAGNSSTATLVGETNLSNIAILKAELEGGVNWGTKRNLTTGQVSSNTSQCSQTAGSCTNTVSTTTYETMPGFNQKGVGYIARGDVSALFPIGEDWYIKAEGIVEKNSATGVLDHYISGPGETATIQNLNVTGKVSIGTAF